MTRFTPTVEMVKRIAQDGYLVVTWANFHYLGFTLSWVEHVKACGVTGYTVGAMDDQILEALDTRSINTFSMKSGLTLGDFGWGSKVFAKMGRQKIRLVELFLELGAQVGRTLLLLKLAWARERAVVVLLTSAAETCCNHSRSGAAETCCRCWWSRSTVHACTSCKHTRRLHQPLRLPSHCQLACSSTDTTGPSPLAGDHR